MTGADPDDDPDDDPRVMIMYTIYNTHEDLPAVPYVVRKFYIYGGDRGVEPGPIVGFATTLDGARVFVPESHEVLLPRSPTDPPTVVETWM